MPKPCYRLRDNDAGVSEVVGTLLILAMTTVLFASIILWVSNIPTPPSSTKLDMDASYSPIFLSGQGANITIRHKGGEDLQAGDIRLYVTITRGGIPSTSVLKVEGIYNSGPLTGKPYGLVDGRDASWNIGERWQWSNYSTLPTDTIFAIVVDQVRNRVLWSGDVLGAPGTHPPIFLSKWADRLWLTPSIDVPYTAAPFRIFAKMTDADNDLTSVMGTLTIFFGTPSSCRDPQTMYDDGTNGDLLPGDGVWTLYRTCMDSPSLAWDGSIVLFNATDAQGHYTTSRLILHVEPNPSGATGGGTDFETGRPPNLRYNGLQGYNLFNGSEWDTKEFAADPTRDFRENEQVVVVVGSALLADSRAQNQLILYDPFSGIPAEPVVYGTSKTVTFTTRPSNNQAFTFYKFVNGYNVFVYKFDLNNASSSGTNFYTNPTHPPYYFYGNYPLTMTVVDSTGVQFVVTDAINVTDLQGNRRAFPEITTFRDSVFTAKATTFQSTDTIYVQVSMLTVDASNANLVFGNIEIRDFGGGTPLFKAPINGRTANPPLCPVSGLCAGNIFTVVGSPTFAYRFAINLSRADQDPWVDGVQSYSLRIASVDDADEMYSNLAASITVVAPLYKLDLTIANIDTVSSAWGTHDFSYVYTAVNGIDRWRKERLLTGLKQTPDAYTKAIKFLDYDRDADLDIAASVVNWNGNNKVVIFLFRQDLDGFGNPVFTRFQVGPVSDVVCADIATGDVTADGAPEILCGGDNGKVWYFKNDGAWTRIDVDTTRISRVTGIDLGDIDGDGDNDIAVSRLDGKVTYYLNLDGQGGFANIAVADDWFAENDYTPVGAVVANSYLATIVSDDIRETIREGTVNEPFALGATTNPDFSSGATNWTYRDWEQAASASGEYHGSGGNLGGYVDVHMAPVSGQRVSGYWAQPFAVTGAGPWTATVDLNYRFVQQGSQFSSLTLFAFVDDSPGAPVIGDAVWSVTLTATGSWTIVPAIDASTRITGPGVYYLKVAARTLYNVGIGTTPTIVGFDNVVLAWSSTAGPVSEMKHFWRLQQLPNRPASTYTLNIEALQSSSSEGDTFEVAYAVGPLAAPPADPAFVTVVNITTASETAYAATLPTNLGGQIVWLRVQDTDRIAGNTVNDTVSVDRLHIRVVTSGGPTGSDITLAGIGTGFARSIDAGDQQGDGFIDIVVGSSNGLVYKLLGSAGGLIAPSGPYFTAPSPRVNITGIKLMNGTTTSPGLEIAFAMGANAYVITGSGTSGTSISGPLGSPGSNGIEAFSAGDIDGDGDDDIVIATGGNNIGAVRYWRNLGGATDWDRKPNGIDIDDVAARIFDLDVGDLSNSQFVGR